LSVAELTELTMPQADFKSKIDRVVRLHASIHEHCSAFKKEYFEKDKAIPDKICSHFSDVEVVFSIHFGVVFSGNYS